MGVAELLADKDARAQRNGERWRRWCTGALGVLSVAGWIWALCLTFLSSCTQRHYQTDCRIEHTEDVVRIGLVTALLTAAWLWNAAALRMERLYGRDE
ncbi:hypothetical protein [Kitasatospora sp. NPDC097643]|uniref:hypothetical protein n=1 Tax=Kitasatospora sp. NPDC097643 TaxID=3157230 RepID=UPI003317A9F7